jgi:hypothetical protein
MCLNHIDTVYYVCGEVTFNAPRLNFTPIIKRCFLIFILIGKWAIKTRVAVQHVLGFLRDGQVVLVMCLLQLQWFGENKHNKNHILCTLI